MSEETNIGEPSAKLEVGFVALGRKIHQSLYQYKDWNQFQRHFLFHFRIQRGELPSYTILEIDHVLKAF